MLFAVKVVRRLYNVFVIKIPAITGLRGAVKFVELNRRTIIKSQHYLWDFMRCFYLSHARVTKIKGRCMLPTRLFLYNAYECLIL